MKIGSELRRIKKKGILIKIQGGEFGLTAAYSRQVLSMQLHRELANLPKPKIFRGILRQLELIVVCYFNENLLENPQNTTQPPKVELF